MGKVWQAGSVWYVSRRGKTAGVQAWYVGRKRKYVSPTRCCVWREREKEE